MTLHLPLPRTWKTLQPDVEAVLCSSSFSACIVQCLTAHSHSASQHQIRQHTPSAATKRPSHHMLARRRHCIPHSTPKALPSDIQPAPCHPPIRVAVPTLPPIPPEPGRTAPSSDRTAPSAEPPSIPQRAHDPAPHSAETAQWGHFRPSQWRLGKFCRPGKACSCGASVGGSGGACHLCSAACHARNQQVRAELELWQDLIIARRMRFLVHKGMNNTEITVQ